MIKESSVLYNIRRILKPKDIVDLGKKFLDALDREELIVACLNAKNEVDSVNVVSIGSLNNSIVHPREVFKTAILSNAASNSIVEHDWFAEGEKRKDKQIIWFMFIYKNLNKSNINKLEIKVYISNML